jgi:hypothetical protein
MKARITRPSPLLRRPVMSISIGLSRPLGFPGLAAWVLCGALVASTISQAAEPRDDAVPPFDRIESAVQRHFAGLDYYRPGDLISRSDVADALDYVGDVGWDVPDRAELEGRVLADNAFIVQKLRTKDGMKFMSQIASLPGGYGRLDRLSAISGGRKLIHTLIHDRGGAELIEYLSTTKEGSNLSGTLAGTKKGSKLNKPTGRIYTVEDLVEALSMLYKEQQKS